MFEGEQKFLGTVEHGDYRIGGIKPFDQTR